VDDVGENWIAVIGSSRKGKNTDLIIDFIIKGLNEKNINVEKYYLNSKSIETCSGCEYCIKMGTCNIHDDITKIIDAMKEADGYILGSPSNNYNMTAQMKAFLDRTFCLNDFSNSTWNSRLAPNKKAIIVGVCAGKTKESMGYTIEGIAKPLSELGVKIIDIIEYYDTKHMQ
jgi:multimeric flavodoxin WrbA